MKERDKKIILLICIFGASIFLSIYFGLRGLALVGSAIIAWYAVEKIFGEKSLTMELYEHAFKIIDYYRTFGITLDDSVENIKGEEIPGLNLRLIWIKNPYNLTFKCNAKSGAITGVKCCTLRQALNEIYEHGDLFVPPESLKIPSAELLKEKLKVSSMEAVEE